MSLLLSVLLIVWISLLTVLRTKKEYFGHSLLKGKALL